MNNFQLTIFVQRNKEPSTREAALFIRTTTTKLSLPSIFYLFVEVEQILHEYMKVLLMCKPSPDCQTLSVGEGGDVVLVQTRILAKGFIRFSGNGEDGSVLCQFNVVLNVTLLQCYMSVRCSVILQCGALLYVSVVQCDVVLYVSVVQCDIVLYVSVVQCDVV